MSREHGIFPLENKAYMAVRVVQSMNCTDSCPLHFEDLALFDTELSVLRRVFVDAIGTVWIHPDNIGYPHGMIAMSVYQEYLGQYDRPVR